MENLFQTLMKQKAKNWKVYHEYPYCREKKPYFTSVVKRLSARRNAERRYTAIVEYADT